MRNFALLALMAALLFGCAAAPISAGMENGRAYRGSPSAKIVIYEYSDFECPFCAKAQPVVEEVLRAYPNEVKLVFRHYPLVGIHPRAMPAAIAAACAEEQGKFWEMHDRLFSSQHALSDSDLQKHASEIGVDMEEFRSCVASGRGREKVLKDMEEAEKEGIAATPTFKIGETKIMGAQPFGKFKQAIESEIARLG
ncbi:MAG: DsbA family protein [Candidatus Micrarchaeota archaeon]|nr:DsbA family protein [Candidatus Micrarchaeota archaeon]